MKIIKTRKGEEIKVSDEDYEELNKYTWQLDARGYATRRRLKRERSSVPTTAVKMHRQVLGLHFIDARESGKVVDHIDRDPSNNQRENLRLATYSGNGSNRKTQINNSTGFRGVVAERRKHGFRYSARIKVEGKRIYIGVFETAADAALAYNEAAIKYHGDFAQLNEL